MTVSLRSLIQLALKRVLDVIVALVVLILTSPITLLSALSIRVLMGRPVFFSQVRPGRNEIPFTLVKFRTMINTGSVGAIPMSDAARLTALGRFLRRTSIDELPQLWNVLTGDMSLVGPRPLLMRYLPYFRPHERVRFLVKPGITGLAQLRGRNTVGWDQRLAYDVAYVSSWTFLRDLKLLAETFFAVIAGRGAVPDANSIMQDLDVERAGEELAS